MRPEADMEDLLNELERSQTQTFAQLTSIDPQTVVYADSGWRVQDVLAHLTAWEEEVIRSLQAHHFNGVYKIPNFDLQAFNDAQYQARKLLPYRQVFEDWIEMRRTLQSMVARLTPEQLVSQMTYPSGRKGNCEALIHEVMEHQAEHIEDIFHALGH